MCREKTKVLTLIMIVMVLLAACTSKAAKALEKAELGQRYLTELNYTEAVASFTEAIGLDPENIPAYIGRAQAYAALEQYAEAKLDYTTVIEKTTEQPYMQAQAYVGRAEIHELTADNAQALSDYESASKVLDTVDLEKITDVTEQMLEAMKIRVYNACARLNAFLGRQAAAVAGYTKALESLFKLPDDAEVLNVREEKITSYTGRSAANEKLENYEEVLPDYDALIVLGEDKTEARNTLLAAISLNQSKDGGLNRAEDWLDEVNHADYAEEIQLTAMEALLKETAAQAEQDGAKAYDKIKELLSAEEASESMQALLARGYQLRCYENGKMLAVYAGATSWEDVNAENSSVTADTLAAVTAPTEEEIAAVSLEKLYVYYGSYEGRSREGEGVWYILNPGSTELTAETYQWENDKPKGDFKAKEVKVQAKSQGSTMGGVSTGKTYTARNEDESTIDTASATQGGKTIKFTSKNKDAANAVGNSFLTIPFVGMYELDGNTTMSSCVIEYRIDKPISKVVVDGKTLYAYVPSGTALASFAFTTTTVEGVTKSFDTSKLGTGTSNLNFKNGKHEFGLGQLKVVLVEEN